MGRHLKNTEDEKAVLLMTSAAPASALATVSSCILSRLAMATVVHRKQSHQASSLLSYQRTVALPILTSARLCLQQKTEIHLPSCSNLPKPAGCTGPVAVWMLYQQFVSLGFIVVFLVLLTKGGEFFLRT